MSEWSGLVYGRTAVKDYRLIALPAWFDDSTVAWASQHLNVVLRDPGGLRRGPRWALFQNESYRVIGVGCLASDLLGRPSDPDQLALTRERSGTGGPGRELYLFAGYAARHDGVAQAAAPSYAALALELFRPLYGLVVARWEERPYQSQPPERTAGAPPPWAVGSGAGARWGRTVALNHDPGQVALWPDTPEWRAELWATGVTAEAPLSLYLGLASQSDALAGPAGNATVAGLAEPREEPRGPAEQPTEVAAEPLASSWSDRASGYEQLQRPPARDGIVPILYTGPRPLHGVLLHYYMELRDHWIQWSRSSIHSILELLGPANHEARARVRAHERQVDHDEFEPDQAQRRPSVGLPARAQEEPSDRPPTGPADPGEPSPGPGPDLIGMRPRRPLDPALSEDKWFPSG